MSQLWPLDNKNIKLKSRIVGDQAAFLSRVDIVVQSKVDKNVSSTAPPPWSSFHGSIPPRFLHSPTAANSIFKRIVNNHWTKSGKIQSGRLCWGYSYSETAKVGGVPSTFPAYVMTPPRRATYKLLSAIAVGPSRTERRRIAALCYPLTIHATDQSS